MKETLNELEIDIEKSKAKISFENLPVISAVPALMQQLFYNLISNAIKFRKKTISPIVHIKGEPMKASEFQSYAGHVNGSKYYKIVVSDNGIGFDDLESQEIFKVFKRLHSYQQYEGTGVGLAICKKIIEKHN